jgi:hypothetical protein
VTTIAKRLPRRDRKAGIFRQFDVLERLAFLRRRYIKTKHQEAARPPDWVPPLFGPRIVSADSALSDYRAMRMRACGNFGGAK